MSANPSKGKLYLLPTLLGEGEPSYVLPISVTNLVARIGHFIVENEKTARRHIKQLVPDKSQADLRLNLLNKHTDPADLPHFLNACHQGEDMGLLSEAGCPGIADPGAEVVSLAHRQGIQVVPMVGPSSILLAMMGSGMNGQSFTFNGYLPIDRSARKNELKNLERLSLEKNQAQIFIETPYRNDKMLETLIQVLHPSTRIAIACDLTLPTEFIQTRTAAEWRKNKPQLHKRPCIFILQRDQ